MKKLLLSKPYNPRHEENRMSSEGSTEYARKNFKKTRFRNLDHLLKSRYSWMNDFIRPGALVVEIGAGAGFSPLYLKERPLLTDAVKNEWIDEIADATDMVFEDSSIDVLIASHTIHHFYSPFKFLRECERVLKPGGYLLVQEINTSLMMRVLLRLMRHEGWSYDVDVFDEAAIVNDPNDLWSANCAVPELLFEDKGSFERVFTRLELQQSKLNECLIFPLSGGVISKTKVPELPQPVLTAISKLDALLIFLFPSIFALGRSAVVKKRGP